MQARVAEQLRDPMMRGLAYGVGGYVGMSFIYSLTNKEHVKAAPKAKEPEHHAPVASAKEHHATAAESSPAAASPAVVRHESTKQQVAPVLQQLSQISDRLTKIEKALGI